MSSITTKDGTQIYFKDWGSGQPIVFSHGWPLTGDAWEDQMVFLASNGFRTIGHDRRGHGRSSQPWDGNHMDQYADDLAELRSGSLQDLPGSAVLVGAVPPIIGHHGDTQPVVAKLQLGDVW